MHLVRLINARMSLGPWMRNGWIQEYGSGWMNQAWEIGGHMNRYS
jgi:hypothetical protein